VLGHGRKRPDSMPRRRRASLRMAVIAALAAVAVLPAQASADDDILAFHDDLRLNHNGSLLEDADVVELVQFAPDAQDQIQVSDKECDGHIAVAEVRLNTGALHLVRGFDCSGRVGVGHVPTGTKVVRFRLCETTATPRCGPITRV
jgi:hypothetical protein